MNLEEEIRNSAGKAEALTNRMRPIKKTFLIMRAEYDSGLIAVWHRVDCAIAKVKTLIERNR